MFATTGRMVVSRTAQLGLTKVALQTCLPVGGTSPACERGRERLAQDHWHKIKKARQRLVLCRLMIDLMRTVHGTYAPASEPFGTRLETFFIGLCVAIGDMEGKPFSVAKIAAYMRVPRTTVIRRLDRAAKLGSDRSPGPSLLHARKDAQFSYRHAKLPTGRDAF